MTYLATLFDINYLGRALTLIDSLKANYKNEFLVYVLCLDDKTFNYFKTEKNEKVIPVSINEVESFVPELIDARRNRSIVEYYFTLSPVWPLFLIKKYGIDHIITLDADIYFFSDPGQLFQTIKQYSIAITPHNFSDNLKSREIYGKYNVSFQSFKNNAEGIRCLEAWKNQCINWCYDRLEGEKYADQKYLDYWPSIYSELLEINMSGCGVAPWNLNREIPSNTNPSKSNPVVLIFYHFHHLRLLNQNLVRLGLHEYYVKPNRLILNKIYRPYINHLLKRQKSTDVGISRYSNGKITLKSLISLPCLYFTIFGFLIKLPKSFIFLLKIRAKLTSKSHGAPN